MAPVMLGWLRGDLSPVRADVGAFGAELGGINLAAVGAWVELCCGDPEPARRFLDAFGDRERHLFLRSSICGQGLAAASLAASRLADPGAARKLLAVWEEVTAVVYTPPPPPALAKAYYQGVLARAAGDTAMAEARLRESLVVHEALAAVPYVAASQAALAEVLLDRGERGEAGELARQAADTASRLGAWGIVSAADEVSRQTES